MEKKDALRNEEVDSEVDGAALSPVANDLGLSRTKHERAFCARDGPVRPEADGSPQSTITSATLQYDLVVAKGWNS